MTFNYKR